MPELDTDVDCACCDCHGFGRPDLTIWQTTDGGWILLTGDGRKAAVAAPPETDLTDTEADQVALAGLVTELRELLGLWGSDFDRQRFHWEMRRGAELEPEEPEEPAKPRPRKKGTQ